MAKITISMPVGPSRGDRKDLRRAVQGIIDQTFQDWRLVVVNDGGDKLPTLQDDPRITIINLSENKGRYYCDAFVLHTCGTEYWGPHDSDDYSPPARYSALIRKADEGYSAVWSDRIVKGRLVVADPRPGELSGSHAHHAGVYRVDALHHGPHPGFRCSWDSVFVSLALLYLRWAVVGGAEYAYYHHKRGGSLSADSMSPARVAARKNYAKIWQFCKNSPVSTWSEVLR